MAIANHILDTDSSSWPQYHDDLLSIQLKETAPMAVAAALSGAADSATSPGITTLARFERSGMIKRIITFRSRNPTGRGLPLMAAAGGPPLGGLLEDDGTSVASKNFGLIEVKSAESLKDLQEALSLDPEVELVSRVPVRYLLARAVPAASPPSTMLWNLRKIGWPEARNRGFNTAAGIRVAVLDTGIDLNHPDLNGPKIKYVHSYIPAATTDLDLVGHGTHVAGVIGAILNNGIGISGICEDCDLSAYKIFSDQPKFIRATVPYFGYVVDPLLYRAALTECLDEDVHIINLSIGGYGIPDPVEAKLFRELQENGTTIIAAMGNENTGQTSYPAGINGVVAVGATRLDDKRAGFSNFGNHITLTAPGVGIWSTLPTYDGQTGFHATQDTMGRWVLGARLRRENNYDSWDGTSMASPHVAAAAALALAHHGLMSPADLRQKLLEATDMVAEMRGVQFTPEYGHGRLNLTKL